jgi:DNA-binding Lrp family transcriptional regulator
VSTALQTLKSGKKVAFRQKFDQNDKSNSRFVSSMDELDQQLISLLRQNARLSVADLAHKLKVSRGTVTNRLRKLEDSQVIVGYTVRLRPEAEPERIRAWTSIEVEGNRMREVIASLLGEPCLATLHDTNGRWDLLAELEVGSMKELSDVLERVRLIAGIRGTETSIHLATYR